MLNLALKIRERERERERLSAAGYLFVVFIRSTATVIYSVLLSAKMIIYIAEPCTVLPLHTPYNPYISPQSSLSLMMSGG